MWFIVFLHSNNTARDFLELFRRRFARETDFLEADVTTSGLEALLDQLDALTAPAERAEGEGQMIFRGETLQVAEEARDGGHHLVVDGR